eukprot:6562611-Pyramimonas_sp.AAC.1
MAAPILGAPPSIIGICAFGFTLIENVLDALDAPVVDGVLSAGHIDIINRLAARRLLLVSNSSS